MNTAHIMLKEFVLFCCVAVAIVVAVARFVGYCIHTLSLFSIYNWVSDSPFHGMHAACCSPTNLYTYRRNSFIIEIIQCYIIDIYLTFFFAYSSPFFSIFRSIWRTKCNIINDFWRYYFPQKRREDVWTKPATAVTTAREKSESFVRLFGLLLLVLSVLIVVCNAYVVMREDSALFISTRTSKIHFFRCFFSHFYWCCVSANVTMCVFCSKKKIFSRVFVCLFEFSFLPFSNSYCSFLPVAFCIWHIVVFVAIVVLWQNHSVVENVKNSMDTFSYNFFTSSSSSFS